MIEYSLFVNNSQSLVQEPNNALKSEANQVSQTLRERRASEQEMDSSNNNPYLQAIRSLSLRDGNSILSYASPLTSPREPRPNMLYPTNVFQKPFYLSMMRDNSNDGIKEFNSSDLLCRKLRMC